MSQTANISATETFAQPNICTRSYSRRGELKDHISNASGRFIPETEGRLSIRRKSLDLEDYKASSIGFLVMPTESLDTDGRNNATDLLLRIEELECALAEYIHRYGFTDLARKAMIVRRHMSDVSRGTDSSN